MGEIVSITGPIVMARDIDNPRVHDLVVVGEERLYGEILSIKKEIATIQVYEPTEGLKVHDIVESLHHPLTVELGPGLLNNIFDGLQRPLWNMDYFLKTKHINRLDRSKRWNFVPMVKKGDKVGKGAKIGYVIEKGFKHFIMLPPNVEGEILSINEGEFNIDEEIAKIKHQDKEYSAKLYQEWPVKVPRPFKSYTLSSEPLITGQRVIDVLFPIAMGGTVAIPGPFGAGKTVLQQCFVKYSNADVKVFVGCGERGNEMADLLDSMKDIKIDGVFFVNTSNMPIIARESSIYTAQTIAEYFRDMGYNVLLMADSLSRWAEALREVSSIMNELPAEEGFPSYLPSRMASFLERAGMVKTLNGELGSLTIISSVSPPGGDFSEPVTQYATGLTGTSLFLDAELAFKRHYPAISWSLSYSKYGSIMNSWFSKFSQSWRSDVTMLRKVLEEETELQELVKAVGFVALSKEQKLKLTFANMVHDGFLKQNAFDPVDHFCPPEKSLLILHLMLEFYKQSLVSDKSAEEIMNNPIITKIIELKLKPLGEIKSIYKELEKEVNSL